MSPSIARDPAGEETPAQAKARLRAHLLALRAALPDRAAHDAGIAQRLARLLAEWSPACVGFYWPIQDEFDARAVVAAWLAAAPPGGAPRRAALPVVADRRGPLEFHEWTPDAAMVSGRFDIPVPAAGQKLIPDLLLVPCVGFSRARYRLGYGGGFYDRTLAALSPPPRTVGIAFAATEVPTLASQDHDVMLDVVITESETI